MIRVQPLAPTEGSATSAAPLNVKLGSGTYFTGSIANLETVSGAVLQVLIESAGALRSVFVRPGDRQNFVNQKMDGMTLLPATALSTDPGTASSVYAKVYGKLLTAETPTEAMHLDANSWVEYVTGGVDSTGGSVTSSVRSASLGVVTAKAVAAGAAIFAVTATYAGVIRANFFTDTGTTIGMSKKRGSVTTGGATKLINSGNSFTANQWQDFEFPVEVGDVLTLYATTAGNFDYTVDNYANAD